MFAIKALTAVLPFLLLALPGQAGPQPEKRYNVQVINNCQNSGQVALTFDDGPFQYEGDIASRFVDNKATFFLNGNNYQCIYDRADEIKALHAAGHTLGSHTWSHPHLNDLTWDQIHDELWRVEEAFIKILGVKPIYFRPPYGEYNDLVLSVLENRGYKKVFLWSDDTLDASGATVGYSEGVLGDIAKTFPKPHLVLSHSVLETTADQVVPNGLQKLWQAGYQMVSVDTCLGSNGEWPYQYVGEPQQRDGSWHC